MRSRTGASLIEVCVLVAVAGTLLAVMVPAFAREVQVSKLAEPAELLAELHARAGAYFGASHGVPAASRCLPGPAGPTPARATAEPATVAFAREFGPSGETWRALAFEPNRPLRFRYSFVPSRSGCDLLSEATASRPMVVLVAEGDLDGDGTLSRFERRSSVDARGQWTAVGALLTRNSVE